MTIDEKFLNEVIKGINRLFVIPSLFLVSLFMFKSDISLFEKNEIWQNAGIVKKVIDKYKTNKNIYSIEIKDYGNCVFPSGKKYKEGDTVKISYPLNEPWMVLRKLEKREELSDFPRKVSIYYRKY